MEKGRDEANMMKAIIFDFDGTIIDTETAWYVVFKNAYEQYGVDLSLETYSQCLGTSLESFNPYTYLTTHHNISLDLEQFRTTILNSYAKLIEKETMSYLLVKNQFVCQHKTGKCLNV